jgi:hypothetical protein
MVEGIFRISGSINSINIIKKEFDAGAFELKILKIGSLPNLENESPHTVSGLLKLFFRELPDPVLEHKNYDAFLSIVQSKVH